MANRMTKAEYDRLKNERYEVVCFRDGKRFFTYGGLSAIQALEQVQYYSRVNPYITVLVFNDKDVVDPVTGRKDTCTARDQSYYEKFTKPSMEAKQGLKIM